MNVSRGRSYRFLFSANNFLAHLLCLLLIFSTPVLASGTCNNTYSLPLNTTESTCVTTTPSFVWDSRTMGERDVRYEYEADQDDECTGFVDPIYVNNPKFLNHFLFGASPRVDNGPIQPLGVDPATLRPESLDLEIFPGIPLSDQLILKPSLSYSEDFSMRAPGTFCTTALPNSGGTITGNW